MQSFEWISLIPFVHASKVPVGHVVHGAIVFLLLTLLVLPALYRWFAPPRREPQA